MVVNGGSVRSTPWRRASLRCRLRALFSVVAPIAGLTITGIGQASDVPLLIGQGTDFGVATAGAGELVTDLAGRLWRLPESGGRAAPITPAGEFVRRPAFSPDGKSIAYETLKDGVLQVIVADADGGNPRQVTSGLWNHLSPAWSPDSTHLTFASDQGGDFDLWELDLDSRALRQLTFEPGQKLDPAWDHAGTSLAYVSDENESSSLLVRSPPQPPRVLLTGERPLRAPSWRPDGSVITFVAYGAQGPRLYMVILSDPPVVKPVAPGETAFASPVVWRDRDRLFYTADGHIRERGFGELTSTDIPFEATLPVSTVGKSPARGLARPTETQPVRGLAGLAVLPDGHAIVSALGDLWELDGNGALVRALTHDAYVDRDPATSADGHWLAFTSDRDGSAQIWAMELTTGDLRKLTAERGFAGHAAWSSRAERLAYLAGDDPSRGGHLDLKVLDAGTRKTITLASGLTQPGTPAWTPDNARIALVQSEHGSARLLLFSVAAPGTLRRVTLPAEAVAPGVDEAQWSPDGKNLLIASAAGIRVLPTLDGGVVGADWRALANTPVRLARWLPDATAAFFTDAEGLARAEEEARVTRIPVPLTWRPATEPGRIIIRATRVFDGTSAEYLPNHEIVMAQGRIVALQPWFTATPGPDDVVIEARGKTVMPGLIDLGIALPEDVGERLGRTLLAYGITTVQVLAPRSAELSELAERWRSHAAGPRILASPEWCGPGPPGTEPPATFALGDGAVRLCPAALDRIALVAPPLRAADTPIWSPSWLAAASGLVDVVGPLGMFRAATAEEALVGRGGFRELYQDAIDAMVTAGAMVVPALATRGLPVLIDDQPDLLEGVQYTALFRPEERKMMARSWRSVLRREGRLRRDWVRDRQRLVGRIAAGGGHLATASGAPVTPYGLGLHAEIRLLAGAGLPRVRVLQMATVDAARAVGLQDELGTIAPGHAADLLIVAGDPLADLAQLLSIEAVVVDGHVRPISSLVGQPAEAAEKFTPAPSARSAKSIGASR